MRNATAEGTASRCWVTSTDPTSAVVAAHPDLANVYYPRGSAALFAMERKGGLIDIESGRRRFDVRSSGFASKLDADNSIETT
jgi:hypothetical protein